MADSLKEARKLAKLVWPDSLSAYTPYVRREGVKKTTIPVPGWMAWAEVNNGLRMVGWVQCYVPTRRAALAGLCGALRTIVKGSGK